MDLNLKSKFSRQVASLALRKFIRLKTGYDVDIALEEVEVTTDEKGLTTAKLKVKAEVQRSELRKLVKELLCIRAKFTAPLMERVSDSSMGERRVKP